MYIWLCHELTAFLHECLILEPDLASFFLTVVFHFDRCPRANLSGGLWQFESCVLVNFSYGVLSAREINLTLFHDTLAAPTNGRSATAGRSDCQSQPRLLTP